MRKDLQNSNKLWAARRWLALGIIFSAALLMAVLLHDPSAHAVPASPPAGNQAMTYELYAGGIDAMEATFNVSYEGRDRYSMAIYAETRGFLGKLVPWHGTFETQGWRFPDGTERPETHKSTAVWQDEEDLKIYKYGKDGSFKGLQSIVGGEEEPEDDIDAELTQGTTDALTAALQAMQGVAEKGNCEGSDEVFDGKRRYRMVFRKTGEEELEPTRYNIYKGPAVMCEIEVVPVAGAWHKKPRGWASIQEQGRAKGSLPTVWLAPIEEKAPAVPVKMRVKTDYGTLFMHLTRYNNGKQEMAAAVED